MNGDFQTSRELFSHPIWKNIVEFRLFFLIYGNAIFSEEGYQVTSDLKLERGQWLRSTRKLQEDLSYIENRQLKTYSTSVINRCIKKLEREQRLCTRSHELGTVFTVVNYGLYQGFSRFDQPNLEHNLEQHQNSVGTVLEQHQNNNNKDNKEKKDNKENKYILSSKPDIPYSEIISYLNEKAGTNYRSSSKVTQTKIKARWKEFPDLIHFQNVVDNQVSKWKGTEWEQYLRPETLFGTKFESYLNSKGGVKNGWNVEGHTRDTGKSKAGAYAYLDERERETREPVVMPAYDPDIL